MAINRWTGGANDGNWSTAGNWSLGAAPVNTNDVIIDVTNQSITTGLNQTGVALASLTISSGVNIGGNGTSLVIGVTGSLVHTGSGNVYVSADTGVQAIVKAVVISTNGGWVYFTGGTVTTLEVRQNANVYIQGSCTVTTLRSDGSTIADAGTAFTTLEQGGGQLITYRSIGTGTVAGSQTICKTMTSAAVTTSISVMGGAKFYHLSSGTLALCDVWEGSTATSQGSTYSAFTLTNSKQRGTGRLFDTGSEPATVTYTNPKTNIARVA